MKNWLWFMGGSAVFIGVVSVWNMIRQNLEMKEKKIREAEMKRMREQSHRQGGK